MQMTSDITIDPHIHHGKAVITGTRVPVSIVVGSIAGGMSQEEVLSAYCLTKEQLEAVLIPAIRYATMADAETLAELSATSFHQAFDGSSKQENVDGYVNAAFHPAQLAIELNEPQSTFCLAELSEQTVGYFKLIADEVPDCISDRKAVELSQLYVRQEFIAQKIGAALMQKALEEARAKGYKTIFLGVC